MSKYLTIDDITDRIPRKHIIQLLEEDDSDSELTEISSTMETRLNIIINSIESRIENVISKDYVLPIEVTSYFTEDNYNNAINVIKELTLSCVLYELYGFQQNDKLPEKFIDAEMRLRSYEEGKEKFNLIGLKKIVQSGIGTYSQDKIFTDTLQGIY